MVRNPDGCEIAIFIVWNWELEDVRAVGLCEMNKKTGIHE